MKKILKIFIILILIPSCQSAQDAFTLQKKNNTDEFLVEKSPLVLPPEFANFLHQMKIKPKIMKQKITKKSKF